MCNCLLLYQKDVDRIQCAMHCFCFCLFIQTKAKAKAMLNAIKQHRSICDMCHIVCMLSVHIVCSPFFNFDSIFIPFFVARFLSPLCLTKWVRLDLFPSSISSVSWFMKIVGLNCWRRMFGLIIVVKKKTTKTLDSQRNGSLNIERYQCVCVCYFLSFFSLFFRSFIFSFGFVLMRWFFSFVYIYAFLINSWIMKFTRQYIVSIGQKEAFWLCISVGIVANRQWFMFSSACLPAMVWMFEWKYAACCSSHFVSFVHLCVGFMSFRAHYFGRTCICLQLSFFFFSFHSSSICFHQKAWISKTEVAFALIFSSFIFSIWKYGLKPFQVE